jgi:hypothetical protein
VKMFQTCGSATLSESGRTTNVRGGSDDHPRVLSQVLLRRSFEGLIDIQAATTPSGLLAPVPLVFASAAVLLRSPCAARLHAGTVSTLVERGRAGVPATPDGVLPSRLPLALEDTGIPSHAGGLPSAAPSRPWGRTS